MRRRRAAISRRKPALIFKRKPPEKQPWPSYDLRRALQADVAALHRKIDRLTERSERLIGRFRDDSSLRWLRQLEGIHMDSAIAEYDRASTRLALVNRLYNAANRKNYAVAEARVIRFVAERLLEDVLDKKLIDLTGKLTRCLHRYLHEKPSREGDLAVRRAWTRLGKYISTIDTDKRFLFETRK